MPDKDGVEIHGRFYPWPDRFRLGDPVLVSQVTGMPWPEFTACLDEYNATIEETEAMGEPPPAPDDVLLAGLIAAAFWQGNPQMTREKARRLIERLPPEAIEVIEGDGEDDAGPPDMAGATPETTPLASSISPDTTSESANPNGSGDHGSVATSPESLPA